MKASALIEDVRRRLTVVEERIRGHPYLEALERGEVARGSLAAFAGEQRLIIASDLRSFAQLVSRCRGAAARGFFLHMVEGEHDALRRLERFAEAAGFAEPYEPRAGCQAYPAFVAQMCRDADPAEVAGAFLVNLDAWGANCARMRDALRDRYGLDDDATGFFDFFADAPPGFVEEAVAVVDAGLEAGVDPGGIMRAARLLQEYELLYWETLPR